MSPSLGIMASGYMEPVGGGSYVKYRSFDGTDDYLNLAIAESATSTFSGGHTVAMLLQRTVDLNDYACWISLTNSGGGTNAGHYTNNSASGGQFWFYNGGASWTADGNTLKVADGWAVIAYTMAAGSPAAARFHRYKYSTDTWFHASGPDVSPGSSDIGSGGFFEICRQQPWGQYLGANVAVAAFWGSVLTDGNIEALADDYAAWVAASPKHLWRFENSPVTDLTSNTADQIAVNGTTLPGLDSPLLEAA